MGTEEKDNKPRTGIVNFERRKYPRFSVDLPVEYYRINPSTRKTGHALDASEGGLLIYLPEQMDIGQLLNLKLYFSSGSELNTIEIVAEVVWIDVHLGEGWGDYRSGVKFIDIFPDDMNKLKDFLLSLSR
jgi:c-di-GMP-binding flagellar brake protein YcgR